LTHKALNKQSPYRQVPRDGNNGWDMVKRFLDHFKRLDMEKYWSEGAPPHDPTVIAST
jgi:inosine-uridine nucleoside N-ribohydrolase